jgi:hypothetical protein
LRSELTRGLAIGILAPRPYGNPTNGESLDDNLGSRWFGIRFRGEWCEALTYGPIGYFNVKPD